MIRNTQIIVLLCVSRAHDPTLHHLYANSRLAHVITGFGNQKHVFEEMWNTVFWALWAENVALYLFLKEREQQT